MIALDPDTIIRPNHEPSAWLRGRLDALRASLESGDTRACVHLHGNAVAAAALWRPGHLLCSACLAGLRLTGEENMQCDRCGTVAADGVRPHIVAVGRLVLLYGVCDTCHEAEVPA